MGYRNLQFITTWSVFAISFSLAACSGPPPVSSNSTSVALPPADASFDQSAFIAAMRAKGFNVENTGGIEQPFLGANGTSLRVAGRILKDPIDLQSFNYADAKSATEDASQIEPSGNPQTMRINWIAPPHFFRRDRVIIIYLGSDANALAVLTELLGTPFAGK